jgi:hypothetical protein
MSEPQRVVVSLGFEPRVWQRESLEGMRGRLRSVLLVHRRGGKTTLALLKLIDEALRLPRSDGQYAYIAPFLKQAKMTAWSMLKRYTNPIPGVVQREDDLSVVLPGGSKIMLMGADNPDAARGIHLDGAVLDEVAQMNREMWELVVSTALLDRNGWVLFIGTVKGITLLSELYRKHVGDAGWYCGRYTYLDTGVLSEEQVALERETKTEAQFRQEFLLDETAALQESLIPMDLVMAASGKVLKLDQYDFEARILGVDVAFSHTGDRSVIFKRQGLMSWKPWVRRGVDNMELAAEVARQSDEWGADAIFVDAGRGEGVISRLRQMNYRPIPVDFGGKPRSHHFANLKAEILTAIRDWLEAGGCLPDDPELQVDLGVLQMDRSERNDKLAVITTAGMPSPDLASGLACTFAAPVRPKARTDLERLEATMMQGKVGGEDYSPFTRWGL